MELSNMRNAPLEELLGLLQKQETGVPKSVVERRLAEKFSQTECRDSIRYALDNFLIDMVIDYPTRSWDIPEDSHVWHLRRLSSEDAKRLQRLKPVKLALLRLLQQQDEPSHVGEMREREAHAALMNRGFKEEDLRSLWIDEMVESLWAFEGDEKVEWLRFIPEYEKTDEYKRAEEERHRMALDREALHTRVADEMDEEERKQKRKTRHREKRSKRQST